MRKIMLDQKITDAMQAHGQMPISSSTRSALWQIRDKALARHEALSESNALVAGMTLIGQKAHFGWSLGLLGGALLIAMLATGNHLLPFGVSPNEVNLTAIECINCQLDKVCRL